MNKPTRITPQPIEQDIGPIDEQGQQILGVEEQAAIERLTRDPEFQSAVAEGLADIRAGRTLTHEEHLAHRAERRRRFLSDRRR